MLNTARCKSRGHDGSLLDGSGADNALRLRFFVCLNCSAAPVLRGRCFPFTRCPNSRPVQDVYAELGGQSAATIDTCGLCLELFGTDDHRRRRA